MNQILQNFLITFLSKSINIGVGFYEVVAWSCVSGSLSSFIEILSFSLDIINQARIFLNHVLNVVPVDLGVMGRYSVVHCVKRGNWYSLLQILQAGSFLYIWSHWEAPVEKVVEDHYRAEEHEECAGSDGEKSTAGNFPVL